jgi:hypothetical protein
MRWTKIMKGMAIIGLLAGMALIAPRAAASDVGDEAVGATPPRLSYIDGQVSYWRPGAEEWVQAQINTALAAGDELFVSGAGNLELQIGTQAFVRAGADTQIGLQTREPDFLRFKIASGQAALDIRSLAAGRSVEVDTPQSTITINQEGYYRLDVSEASTSLVTRRGGRAAVLGPGGQAMPVASDERVVIQGPSDETIAFQVAPEVDDWDHWNYDRTDQLLATQSRNYVSPGTYGASDLDRYGAWRVLPTYGPVWIPSGVDADWAPYSTGSWVYDPYYGWTWVDAAPWGWAPYHYGRWIYAHNYWCWAPGPVVRRAVYAPALVAFLGGPGVGIGISIGGPSVGWVALGWGEPLVPWWGRSGFIHRVWWGGWGGPHVVNGQIIGRHAALRVEHIEKYGNMHIHHAIVAVEESHFGHGPITHGRLERRQEKDWRPSHEVSRIHPTAAGYVPMERRGARPAMMNQKHAIGKAASHPRGTSASSDSIGPHFRSSSRPAAPSRGPNPSDGHRFDKRDRPAVRQPATAPHPKATAAPDTGSRDRTQPHSGSAPVLTRSNPQPSDHGARDRAAEPSRLQRRQPAAESVRTTVKSPQRPKAFGAVKRSEHPAPANRTPIQAIQPGPRSADAKSTDRPAVRRPSGPVGADSGWRPGPSRTSHSAEVAPPQVPSRRPDAANHFQERTGQSAAPDAPAPRNNFSPSPATGSGMRQDQGAHPGFESRHGFGRRSGD